jgi:processive 1,2-diacylglycerol beta-glucosyltransferase
MYNVYDVASGDKLGQINQAQLDFLVAQLEEESPTDRDYYINATTIDFFAQKGADAELLTLLRNALGTRDDMDIRWAAA